MALNSLVEKGYLYFDTFDQDLKKRKYTLLETASTKTGQKRAYLVLAVAVIFLSILWSITSLRFISHLVALLPIYRSYKALKTPEPDDDALWLTYWVVSGSFSVMESFLSAAFTWLPLFFIVKIPFLLWAHHPSTKGSLILYKHIFEPVLDKISAVEEKGKGGGATSPTSFSSSINSSNLGSLSTSTSPPSVAGGSLQSSAAALASPSYLVTNSVPGSAPVSISSAEGSPRPSIASTPNSTTGVSPPTPYNSRSSFNNSW